jgi:hypothetical protein
MSFTCSDCLGVSYCDRRWLNGCEPKLKVKLENDLATLERIKMKRNKEERGELDRALADARAKLASKEVKKNGF